MKHPDSNVFWHWALECYRHKPLQTLLLQAQDRFGCVVLEVMYGAWLAEQGLLYDTARRDAVTAAITPWEAEVVRPLRAQRRRWHSVPGREDHYRHLQQLELDAERHLAALMVAAGPALPAVATAMDPAENLGRFASTVPEARPLLAAIANCFVQLGGKDPLADSGAE